MEAYISRYQDLVVIGVFVLALAGFYALRRYVLKKIGDKRDFLPKWLAEHLGGPVQFLFVLSAIYALLQRLSPQWTDDPLFGKIYSIGMIFGTAWLAVRGVSFAARLFLKRYDIAKRDNLSARAIHTQVNVARRLAIAVIITIAIAAMLMSFEQIRALGVSLLASAGVAGIVLGLAAQKTIGNFFTGIQIAITQPIRMGDAVVVENEWGWIEEINLTYVVVKIWDQRRLVLPISYFVDHPFQNWTRTTADILGSVMLYLDYTMPLQPLRDELDRILEQDAGDLWDGKVKVVQVTDTTEKSMVIRVLVSAGDSPSAWDLRCLVREKLIAFMQEKYPQHLPRFRADVGEVPQKTGSGNG